MKITSLISASALALALAAPVYAQTAPAAPATPAVTPAAPATPAATPAANPTAFANVPAIQQVNAQLTAQGYTITDVVKNANGSYSVLSTSAGGQLRLITVNPATGAVTDTVTAGVAAGTNGVTAEGTLTHEAGEAGEMEGNDDGGRKSHDRNEGGNEGGEGNEGGSDSDD